MPNTKPRALALKLDPEPVLADMIAKVDALRPRRDSRPPPTPGDGLQRQFSAYWPSRLQRTPAPLYGDAYSATHGSLLR